MHKKTADTSCILRRPELTGKVPTVLCWRAINRKSPKTGTNFLRKAKDYFKIEKRTTVIESNVGRRYFDEFRKHYTGGHFLFYFNGRIFERKCDLVSFNYQNQITA